MRALVYTAPNTLQMSRPLSGQGFRLKINCFLLADRVVRQLTGLFLTHSIDRSFGTAGS